MWNLKKNENKNDLIDTKNRLQIVIGVGSLKWVRGVKRYKLPVTK